MLDEQTRDALIAWLEWQIAMGVDAAVDAAAIDWTARPTTPPGHGLDIGVPPVAATAGAPAPTGPPGSHSQPPPAPAAPRVAPPSPPPAAVQRAVPTTPVSPRPAALPPTPQPARQFPTAAPDAAEASARQLARSAASLAELQGLLASFDGCALKATAKSLCFYRGAEQAPLMLIGEAPGRDEDLEGKPFVGRAGQLLDKMLKAGGWTENDVHITNVVYWRPPGNRTPTPQEVQVCRPFLERQVGLVQPRVILLLGGAAAKAVLDIPEGIMRVRGKWHSVTIAGHAARVMATLHPAYLLRTPAAKRLAWRDLLALRAALDGM